MNLTSVMNPATMICRRILSNSLLKSSASSAASSHYDPFVAPSFKFYNVTHQIRHFSARPRFDFGDIRNPDDAVALFRYMMRTRPLPSVVNFTKLLSSVVKIKQYNAALFLLDEMFQKKVPVNHFTLSIAVKCFCSLKRVDFGFAILATFLKRGYEPDVVVLNKLIDGLLLVEKVCEAEKLFKKFLLLKLWGSRLKHNIVSYNSLMSGYCKKGQVDEVLRIFNEIPAKGLERDVVSYNTMMEALFDKGKYDDGLKLFREMTLRRVTPNLMTYSILLQGLCTAHRIDEALALLPVMENEGFIPDLVTYNTLIGGLCSDEKLGKAIDLFNELGKKGVQPDVVTCNIIIGALCEEGHTEEAKDLLVQMIKNGCLPNSGTYNVLVRGLVKTNMIKDLIPVMEEMERRKFMLDEATLDMLLVHVKEKDKDGIVFAKMKKLVF